MTTAPEVDQAEDPLVGVVALRRDAETTAVGAIMERQVHTLSSDDPLSAITELFLERELSSAPILNAKNIPVGIITKTDLLRQLSQPAAPQPAGGETPEPAAQRLMCLHETASISVAAALMAHTHIHRLPIVATGGRLVGIVSTLDIVRWLARATGMDQVER